MARLKLYGCYVGRKLEALTLANDKREAKRIMVGDDIGQLSKCGTIVNLGRPYQKIKRVRK